MAVLNFRKNKSRAADNGQSIIGSDSESPDRIKSRDEKTSDEPAAQLERSANVAGDQEKGTAEAIPVIDREMERKLVRKFDKWIM